jgi:hypothetical protein
MPLLSGSRIALDDCSLGRFKAIEMNSLGLVKPYVHDRLEPADVRQDTHPHPLLSPEHHQRDR